MQKNNWFVFQSFLFVTFLFYLPGLVLFSFFTESYTVQYKHPSEPFTSFFVIGGVYVFSFTIMFILFNKVSIATKSHFSSNLVQIIMTFIVIVYFVSSIIFFINFDASFRHTSRLNDAGVAVKLLFFLQPLINIYIVFSLIHCINGNYLGKNTKRLIFIYIIGMLLSLNSALQLIAIVCISTILFKPELLNKPFKNIRFSNVLLITISVISLVLGVVIVGLGNKVGFQYLFSNEGLDFIYFSIGNIVARISSSLISNSTLFECCSMSQDASIAALESFYTTFLNRLSLILPLGETFNTDIIDTVNRANFLLIFNGEIARAGASPGILASIFYIPIYPLGFILLPLFYVFISKVITAKVRQDCEYNILTLLILPFLILPFFEAPLNIFYLIDPVFISFMFFMLFLFVNINQVYNK